MCQRVSTGVLLPAFNYFTGSIGQREFTRLPCIDLDHDGRRDAVFSALLLRPINEHVISVQCGIERDIGLTRQKRYRKFIGFPLDSARSIFPVDGGICEYLVLIQMPEEKMACQVGQVARDS